MTRLAQLIDDEGCPAKILHDARVLWFNADRMAISGLERKNIGGEIIDYEQSWDCSFGVNWRDGGAMNEAEAPISFLS